jgi:hypothetical protein
MFVKNTDLSRRCGSVVEDLLSMYEALFPIFSVAKTNTNKTDLPPLLTYHRPTESEPYLNYSSICGKGIF